MHMPYLEYPMSMYGANRGVPTARAASLTANDHSASEFSHIGTYTHPLMNQTYPTYSSF